MINKKKEHIKVEITFYPPPPMAPTVDTIYGTAWVKSYCNFPVYLTPAGDFNYQG